MQTRSRDVAQQRADRVGAFREELDDLLRQEVVELSSHQLQAISGYHEKLLAKLTAQFDIDVGVKQKQLSLGMRITSLLGALAFSASLFFLFYQFWGFFPTAAQVAILVILPLLLLCAASFTAFRETSGYYSKILGLLAVAAFVLNLSMLGQIFNIAPSTGAFLVWALFSLLLAYATGARILLVAGIVALAGFLSAKMGTWSGCYWIHFGERPENFFPAAVVIFCASLLPLEKWQDFRPIYRVFGLLFLFIPILILSNYGRISYFPFNIDVIEGGYQIAGFLLSALFISLGVKKSWNDVTNAGMAFFIIFLYTKFFDWWWEWLPKYIFFLLIGVTSVVFLFLFQKMRKKVELAGREDRR